MDTPSNVTAIPGANQTLPAEARNRVPQTIIGTVPAGGFLTYFPAGSIFYLEEANGPLMVKTDISPEAEFTLGLGRDLSPNFFRLITLRNANAFAVTFRMVVQWATVIDHRLNIVDGRLESIVPVIEQNTEIIPDSHQSLNNEEVVFDGTPPTANHIRRKCLQVSNEDASLKLYITDGSGNQGLTVFPGTSVTVPISGVCGVANPIGSAVACRISEVWYVRS